MFFVLNNAMNIVCMHTHVCVDRPAHSIPYLLMCLSYSHTQYNKYMHTNTNTHDTIYVIYEMV